MPDAGKSLNDIEQEIRSAFDSQFRKDKEGGDVVGGSYIRSIFLDGRFVVTEKNGKQYKVPFGEDYKFADEKDWEEGSLRSEWAAKAGKSDDKDDDADVEIEDDAKVEDDAEDEAEAESQDMAKELQYAK
jgi:hypothetical protein